ncbi:HIT family protein [Fructilactobacillus carniphilus]|uniref:HIT domain-containing protein n=1 Tax=Fructilactobacillus carniphilus TaxID=2940297 RepID=A0ABY5BY97_9LACO|nr:HIT domain-containing protein [Fructilactobacillus carniphilus]USS90613.1 hypothetical protein M3M37_07225 [Fructilactobacillus carniphilus]
MKDWQTQRIIAAQRGENPMVMAETEGGYAAFGDVQFLPGYSVLLPKHEVSSLNDLSTAERNAFLMAMTELGDALLAVCHPYRINYDILGNTDQFLHAHVFPRYQSERIERRLKPVWLYPASNRSLPTNEYQPDRDDPIRKRITEWLLQHGWH